MPLLSGLLGVVLCLHCACASPGPSHAVDTSQLAEVRDVHQRVSQVLRHGSLRGELAKEAERIDAEAEAVLESKVPNATAATVALSDYQMWFSTLKHLQTSLHADVAHQVDEVDAEAKQMMFKLEQKADRLLGHLSADKSADHAKERQAVVAVLKAAVMAKDDPAAKRVLQLHAALVKAHDFLVIEAKYLTAAEEKLKHELQEEHATVLFKMLKQRRGLPMTSQFAVLRRTQFASLPYAKELLKAHDTSTPLYMQLERLLSQGLVHRLHEVASKKKDHMAVRGSEGRVHIVSSRMKESVSKMFHVLTDAREKLASITRRPAASAKKGELEDAKKIVASLDRVLHDVGATKDLTKQLDALDGMRVQLDQWMKVAATKGYA